MNCFPSQKTKETQESETVKIQESQEFATFYSVIPLNTQNENPILNITENGDSFNNLNFIANTTQRTNSPITTLLADNVIGNFPETVNQDFKLFPEMSDENLIKLPPSQDSLILIDSLNETHSKTQLSLQEKIMQNGLQNTIVEMTENSPSTNSLFFENSLSSQIVNEQVFENLDGLFIQEGNDGDNNEEMIGEQQSEAVELAIASEEEIPSPWIDVMTLTAEPALRTESWPELNAFPTAVHSLVDLVGPEPYPLEIENQDDNRLLDNVVINTEEGASELNSASVCNEDSGQISIDDQLSIRDDQISIEGHRSDQISIGSHRSDQISIQGHRSDQISIQGHRSEQIPIQGHSSDQNSIRDHNDQLSIGDPRDELLKRNNQKQLSPRRNILEEIAADADICKCEKCDCTESRNCHNCSSSSSLDQVNNENTSEIPSLIGKCPSDETKNCDSSCAVVICVKTLQQLQTVLNTCCKVTSNCAVACTRGELFSGHNMSLLATQLTGNH